MYFDPGAERLRHGLRSAHVPGLVLSTLTAASNGARGRAANHAGTGPSGE